MEREHRSWNDPKKRKQRKRQERRDMGGAETSSAHSLSYLGM